VAPGRLLAGIKTILPGYSDEVALSLGLLDADGSLEAVRARYRINDRARAAGASVDFSRLVRAR